MLELRHHPTVPTPIDATNSNVMSVTDHHDTHPRWLEQRHRSMVATAGSSSGGGGGDSNTSSGSHNSGGTNSHNSHGSAASWRKGGERMRQTVIEEDERMGGQAFLLSSSCPIYRYYHVADKVLDQFLHHPIDSPEEQMEAYTVGHRLVKFLSHILPTHDDYFSEETDEADARHRSLEQLVAVLKYLDQIAILIDKQAHEDYIRAVLTEENELHEFGDEDDNAARDVSLIEESYYGDDDCEEYDVYDRQTEPVRPLQVLPARLSSNIDASEALRAAQSNSEQVDQFPTPNIISRNNGSGTTLPSVVQRKVTPENSFTGSQPSVSPAQSTPSPRAAANPWLTAPKTTQPKQPLSTTPLVRSAQMARLEHRREKPGVVDGTANRSSEGPLATVSNSATPIRDSDEHPLSPGDSVVQSRVKAWPPKPDPPAQRYFPGIQNTTNSLEQSHSSVDTSPQRVNKSQISFSSVESSPSRLHRSMISASSVESNSTLADRPSTPLPLEKHAISATSPEIGRPLLQLSSNSPDNTRLRFKPLTELQVHTVEKERESAFKKSTPSNGRVRWADTHFPSVGLRRADRSGFSSSSCSSRDSDDVPRNDLYMYKSINPTDQEPTAGQAASDGDKGALTSSPTRELKLDLSKSLLQGASTTSAWREGNKTNYTMDKATLSNGDIDSKELQQLETKVSIGLSHTHAATNADPYSNANIVSQEHLEAKDSIRIVQSYVATVATNAEPRVADDVLVLQNGLNVSTDSNGFPIVTNSTISTYHHAKYGAFGALNESRDSSLLSRMPEMEDTSGSVASVSPRNFGGRIVHANSKDLLSFSGHKVSSSFTSIISDDRQDTLPASISDEHAANKESYREDAKQTTVVHVAPNPYSIVSMTLLNRDDAPTDKQKVSLETSNVPTTILSNSYAPSVAEWTSDDGDRKQRDNTNSKSVSVDNMGFPVGCSDSMSPESFSKESSAIRFLSENRAPSRDDNSVKSTALKSTEGISYAVPQSLVVAGSFDSRLSQSGWADAWDTVVDGTTIAKDTDTKKSSALSEDSMVQFWTSKGRYPRVSDPALDPAISSLPYETSDQQTQQPPLIVCSDASRTLSTTHSQERDSQYELGSATSTKKSTHSRRSQVVSPSPSQVESTVSLYMSESKSEQRLKHVAKGDTKKAPVASPVIELTPSSSLELIQHRSMKYDRRGRGNKLLCRKQKGTGVVGITRSRSFPNELDSLDDASLLTARSQSRGHHFTSCVRCLID